MKYLQLDPEGVRRKLIAGALNYLPQGGGLTISQQRARFRIFDAVEAQADADVLALEDADAKELQRIVPTVQWLTVNRAIVEFGDAVANMPSEAPRDDVVGPPIGSEARA